MQGLWCQGIIVSVPTVSRVDVVRVVVSGAEVLSVVLKTAVLRASCRELRCQELSRWWLRCRGLKVWEL